MTTQSSSHESIVWQMYHCAKKNPKTYKNQNKQKKKKIKIKTEKRWLRSYFIWSDFLKRKY